jgi:hypothetical protein
VAPSGKGRSSRRGVSVLEAAPHNGASRETHVDRLMSTMVIMRTGAPIT